MAIQKLPGITGTPVNHAPLQTGSKKPLSEPKYTLVGVDSELMERIGYIALRVFFTLGAIGLMATGYGLAIALGVLLVLAVVCTLPKSQRSIVD